MPRLLSINNYHYRRGGADAVYLDNAALFRAEGWDTAFFSMHHPKNEPSDWARFFVDEIEFGRTGSLVETARKAGKVIYSLEGRRRLDALLDVFTPDVAHVHAVYHHISPAVLPVLKRRGVPIVYTAHDLKLACPAYKMLNAAGLCERCRSGNLLNVLRHRCIKNSAAASAVVAGEAILHRFLRTYPTTLDRIVVPSRFYGEKLAEWGWPRERLRYIPNFIDVPAAEAIPEPGDYLLYVGRLAPEKGVATLIRAAHEAGLPLRIAGSGPEDEDLKALAAALGAHAVFLGHQTGSALRALVAGARVLALPSEWYENAPLSILEALAAGKVVVGARIGGIPELLEEQPASFLFESGSVPDLVVALDRAWRTSPDDLKAIGAANRRSIAGNFSRDLYRERMGALYGELGAG